MSVYTICRMGVGSLRNVKTVREWQGPTGMVTGDRQWPQTKGEPFSDVCECAFRKDNKVQSFFAPHDTCYFVYIAWS